MGCVSSLPEAGTLPEPSPVMHNPLQLPPKRRRVRCPKPRRRTLRTAVAVGSEDDEPATSASSVTTVSITAPRSSKPPFTLQGGSTPCPAKVPSASSGLFRSVDAVPESTAGPSASLKIVAAATLAQSRSLNSSTSAVSTPSGPPQLAVFPRLHALDALHARSVALGIGDLRGVSGVAKVRAVPFAGAGDRCGVAGPPEPFTFVEPPTAGSRSCSHVSLSASAAGAAAEAAGAAVLAAVRGDLVGTALPLASQSSSGHQHLLGPHGTNRVLVNRSLGPGRAAAVILPNPGPLAVQLLVRKQQLPHPAVMGPAPAPRPERGYDRLRAEVARYQLSFTHDPGTVLRATHHRLHTTTASSKKPPRRPTPASSHGTRGGFGLVELRGLSATTPRSRSASRSASAQVRARCPPPTGTGCGLAVGVAVPSLFLGTTALQRRGPKGRLVVEHQTQTDPEPSAPPLETDHGPTVQRPPSPRAPAGRAGAGVAVGVPPAVDTAVARWVDACELTQHALAFFRRFPQLLPNAAGVTLVPVAAMMPPPVVDLAESDRSGSSAATAPPMPLPHWPLRFDGFTVLPSACAAPC